MRALACSAAILLAAGAAACAHASDTSLKQTFKDGMASAQTGDYAARERAVRRTLSRLRGEHASTTSGRRARTLAIDGFRWARRGLLAQLEFVNEDSGRLAEATIDATRADRCWRRGARLLRRAGRELGVSVGLVNGY